MKKILLPLILLSVIFVSGCVGVSFEKHITVDCKTCSSNTTEIDDCVEYYEKNKDSAVIKKLTDKLGIGTDIINVTRIEKTISYPSGDVGCKYFFD